jgi:hypothetical protein
MLVLRTIGLGPDTPDTHDKVRFLQPTLRERVRTKSKELLVEDELRKRRTVKMTMIAEGAEAQRVEKEQAERKRKHEDKAAWEGACHLSLRCRSTMLNLVFVSSQILEKHESQTGEASRKAAIRRRDQRCWDSLSTKTPVVGLIRPSSYFPYISM